MKKTNIKAYNSLVASGILWGLAPLFYKKGLLAVSIVIFLAFRFAFGAVFIYATQRKKFKQITLKISAIVLIFAIVDSLLVNLVYSFAIQRTTILHIAIINLAVPFLVYLFAAIILHEKPHRIVIIGSLIGVLGLGIIVGSNSVSGGSTAAATLAGDVIMLGCVTLSSLTIVLGRKVLSTAKKLPLEQLGFMEYAVSAIPLFVIMIISHSWMSVAAISPQSWFWILGAATISGALPVIFYYRAVKKLRAERLADISFISPAVSGVVGISFLGESLTLGFAVGTALVVAGLLVSHRKLHPVLIAHQVGAELKIIESVFRYPKKAYAYVYSEARKIL